MPAITVQQVVVGGTIPSLVAADVGGDTFVNDGAKTIFIVNNGGAGSINVTFDGTGTGPTSAVAFDDDVTTAVAAGVRTHFGPFPKGRFGATVSVSYSGITTVTVAATTL